MENLLIKYGYNNYKITYQVYSYFQFNWAEYLLVYYITDEGKIINKKVTRLASREILVIQLSPY